MSEWVSHHWHFIDSKFNAILNQLIFFTVAHLEEINVMLKREDPNTRPLRRAIGFMDILNKVTHIKILVSGWNI